MTSRFRLGRALGQYQRPALVAGTSYIVKFGWHDWGAISATAGVFDKLNPTSPDDFETVVLERVYHEYNTFWNRAVLNEDYDIPKASLELLYELDPTLFPEEIKDMMDHAKDRWRRTSEKASRGGTLDRADLDVLAYVEEQEANHRETYVLTYDEDESSPVKQMQSTSPWVHYAEESLQPVGRLARELHTDEEEATKGTIILDPHVLGKLYGMAFTSTMPKHYLLTVKVSIAGSEEEFGISIHPLPDRRLVFEEEKVSRYPLVVVDIEKALTAVKTVNFRLQENMYLDRLKRSVVALRKNYPKSSYILVNKSRAHGHMRMSKGRNRMLLKGKELFSEADETSLLNWLTIDNNYLRKFSPETLENLEEFRRSVPR